MIIEVQLKRKGFEPINGSNPLFLFSETVLTIAFCYGYVNTYTPAYLLFFVSFKITVPNISMDLINSICNFALRRTIYVTAPTVY